jgi:Domain of unknown function (DUF4342)
MEDLGRVYEEIKVRAADLKEKVKDLIHESNVRRVIIKDDHGVTFMEVPLSVATLGVIAAPVLSAVGAIATALAHFTVVVERAERGPGNPLRAAASSSGTTSGFGATEDLVSMKHTVAQRIDSKGTKVEDLGGVGGNDAKGG